MDLDKLIEQKIKESRLYGVNKPSIIKNMLKIPNSINIKKLDKEIDNLYDTFYIKKNWIVEKSTKKSLKEKFVNTEKDTAKRVRQIPIGEKVDNYRKIFIINKDWLKKSQKKFNKILSNILLSKKIRGKKQESIIPYLHSSVKQRSYNTNARVHLGNRYVFSIDLKDFYPSITKYKLYLFFRNKFNLSPDIAMFYSVFSTSKADDGSYRLGQGLSQSSTLAYLANYSLFNYLYNLSLKNNIEMSIYVDDIIFSSENKIPQSFIDKLFGIIRGNGMLIKRQKIHNYMNDSVKKITGVYIKGNKTRVSNRKHFEFDIQYKYLKKEIKKIKCIEDYYEIYNLYLKFYGNFQNIKMVEGKVHDKYNSFIKKYDIYFPKGINKKQKGTKYMRGNIKTEVEIKKINRCYLMLKNLGEK